MKVLMLNGSNKLNGNTNDVLTTIGEELWKESIEYEIFHIGNGPARDCIGCKKCTDNGCIFTDDRVNEFIEKARAADGFVFGTPVYFAHPSGRILSFLDRAFYSCGDAFRFKPGAAVTVARRGGSSASHDCLTKYFGIAEMPIPGTSYWNVVYGRNLGEALQDAEGMHTMRNLACNLAWIMKCIDAGKERGIALPKTTVEVRMNFII